LASGIVVYATAPIQRATGRSRNARYRGWGRRRGQCPIFFVGRPCFRSVGHEIGQWCGSLLGCGWVRWAAPLMRQNDSNAWYMAGISGSAHVGSSTGARSVLGLGRSVAVLGRQELGEWTTAHGFLDRRTVGRLGRSMGLGGDSCAIATYRDAFCCSMSRISAIRVGSVSFCLSVDGCFADA
jgi:hypothetical protein